MRVARPAVVLGTIAVLGLIGVGRSFAEGSLSGHITVPGGTDTKEMRVVLIPAEAKHSRRSIKIGKKGDYFFGMVPEGRYSLSVEGTTLVPTAIKLIVHDTEAHKDIVNYDGPAPTEPQAFDVDIKLKVTYDITLGPAAKAPSAVAAAAEGFEAVPGLIQSGEYASALEKIDATLKLTADDPIAHYYRAMVLFRTKDLPGAQAEVEKALTIRPDLQGGHWLMGAVLASSGRKEEAIAEFQKEIANEQSEPSTKVNSWINVGLIERELGHKDRAITAFEKVIELDPSQSEAYSYLAELYIASGQPAKAAEIQAKSKAAGAEDAGSLYNLGASFWNAKEYDKAEQYFKRATEVDPKFPAAWEKLGYALVRTGKTAEAVAAFETYLKLSPNAANAAEIRQMIDALKN